MPHESHPHNKFNPESAATSETISEQIMEHHRAWFSREYHVINLPKSLDRKSSDDMAEFAGLSEIV